MRDTWRLPGIAVALIVLLRISIGWQFLYEGLWKLNTFTSAKPWTSAGYLRNARGPFRDLYRNMTGDPNDLNWLDYDAVAARWDDWKASYLATYADLTEDQQRNLTELIEGAERFAAPLAKLPEGFKFSRGLDGTIWYDAEAKRLAVDGKKHLLPREKLEIEKQLSDKKLSDTNEGKDFLKALDKVYRLSAKLGYKERLLALLKGDPERVGHVYRDEKSDRILEQRKGTVEQYQVLLSRYEAELARVRQDFERRHLATQADEIQKLRTELVGPVRALDAELKQDARKLLAIEQLRNGPVPERRTRIQLIDHATIGALIVLGGLLIAGLFSRLAAVAAAGLLLSFYLAVPPWPGVEELIETAGPEHSFIVNKNAIEVIALLAIAFLPTGQWFGLDRLLSGLCCRRK